jgi:hypothetical protein
MIHGSLISGGAIESALKKPWQDLIICLEAGVGWHRIVRDSSLGEKFCTARWGHYMVHYVLYTDQNICTYKLRSAGMEMDQGVV